MNRFSVLEDKTFFTVLWVKLNISGMLAVGKPVRRWTNDLRLLIVWPPVSPTGLLPWAAHASTNPLHMP